MKRVVLFLLAAVVVAGFGGCGGGGDDGLPGECIAYCQDACNKFVVCKFFSIELAPACADGCVDSLKDEGDANASDCVNANVLFDTLTCNQLGDLVDAYMSAADIGSGIGSSCSK